MTLHDLFAHGKADARAGVFLPCVQALKDQKDTFAVFGSNADAVIAYGETPFVSLAFG